MASQMGRGRGPVGQKLFVAGARGEGRGKSVSFSAASLVCGLLAAVWVSF